MISVGMITYVTLVCPAWIPAATNCVFYLKLGLVNNLDLEIPKHFVKLYFWKRMVLKIHGFRKHLVFK